MIVEIKYPSSLLIRDKFTFPNLAQQVKVYLAQHHINYSLNRYSHKVDINFDHQEDAIMFKLVFSERL